MENTKICGICKVPHPTTSEYFASRKLKSGKTILQGNCRCCQKDYRKKHYEKNLVKYKNKAVIYRNKTVKDFEDFKSKLSCEKCGEKRHWVLDFHHMDSSIKEENLSRLIRSGSKKRVEEELKKCIVLCANCHRDLHYYKKASFA